MTNNPAKHLSNSFNLNIDKLPCKAVDRYSVFSAIIFFLLALMLLSLGIYELMNGIRLSDLEVEKLIREQGGAINIPLISPTFFDVILIVMGAGLALSMIMAVIRYKKVHFDGDFVRA